MLAAFDQSEFHWILGRSSKTLLPKACLLPLTKVSFIGFEAEAAKPCFQRHVCCLWLKWASLDPWRRQQKPASKGMFAAFDQNEFHWVRGRGSKNLLPKVCLLPLIKVSFIGPWQRQQNKEKSREWLPLGKQVRWVSVQFISTERWVPDNFHQKNELFT